MVQFYFYITYNFVVELSVEASVETAYGFKIGIIKGTDPGLLATKNYYDPLI